MSLLLAAILLTKAPAMLATAVSNVALVEMVDGADCTMYWSDCRTGMGDSGAPWQGAAARWRPWLDRFHGLLPGADELRLRRAEAAFAAGDPRAAAALLPATERGAPPRSDVDGSFAPVTGSRLLAGGRYENYLVAAYQELAAGERDKAIEAFRWAFSLAPEHVQEADYRAYYGLMAERHAQGDGVRDGLRAGQYAVWAGRAAWAEQLLQALMAAPAWQSLTARERAAAWTYLGRARAARDAGGAVAAYREAMALVPNLAEPRLRLWALRPETADLLPAGPGYWLDEPLAWKGRTLVGFDVEEAAVEAGGLVDVWLWWQAAGEYRIERRRAVNLAPNPGFEWGMAGGLPVGYYALYRTGSPEGVNVMSRDTAAGENHVLSLANNGWLGVRSYPLAVDPDGLYLMAARVEGRSQEAGIGRKCFTPDYPADRRNNLWGMPQDPFVRRTVAAGQGEGGAQPAVVAFAGRPVPQGTAVLCQLFLDQRGGEAQFDDVLFVRVSAENGP